MKENENSPKPTEPTLYVHKDGHVKIMPPEKVDNVSDRVWEIMIKRK